MADPGDGSVHREFNWTKLHYAGDGKFYYEEDMYNPVEFGDDDQGLAQGQEGRRPELERCYSFRSHAARRGPFMEFGIFNSLYTPHQAVRGRRRPVGGRAAAARRTR